MAIGSRAWRALMRRNLIYRKRHFVAAGFELVLPVAFLGIVVGLKNASDIEDDDFYSEIKSTGFYENMGVFVALLMTLSLLYPTAAIIRYIVQEKELRQKELLKMMSVTEADIGWAWFSTFCLLHLVTCALTTWVSAQIYSRAQIAVLLVFWIFSFTSFIVVAMLVASLFSKTPRATFVGLLVFFFGYFITLAEDMATADPNKLFLVSLHPIAAFSYGFREIGRLEDTGMGLTFDTIDTTVNESGYTFASVLGCLFLDSLLWGLVTWYLNRVIKPTYGQAMPIYFPFLPSYWCPCLRRNKVDVADINSAAVCDDDIPIEKVSDATRMQAREGKSIEIHKLKKTFGEKTAVDGLSLSIYNGEITALLGHNGAGKTTTINILIGATKATDGTAVVAGKDIDSSMQQIRQDMGICLQHDCIFPSLTVREHLQLFCRIKGMYAKMPYAKAEEKITQSLKDVALEEKSGSLAKNLSGGMKRKMSVAMAFCGDSKVVILDEPTSGMDPYSRRFTWNVIRRYRKNRTIILTTHHMDEADVLGDTIAIMAQGRLRCCGSSLFLKKKFGVGYQLSIEKKVGFHHPNNRGRDSDIEKDASSAPAYDDTNYDETLQSIVQGTVEEASLLSAAASEMRFQLPMSASHQFIPMLRKLDAEVAQGYIGSYGLGLTTLEEVFVLVSRGDNLRSEVGSQNLSLRGRGAAALTQDDFERDKIFLRHAGALFKKRWLNFKRDKKAWLFTTILPSLFVFIGFMFFESLNYFAIWFLVVLSFPFIAGSFGSFVVAEKQNKSKHLQAIAGVTPTAYWMSTFLWDVMNYQFTLWITVILMFAFGIDDLTTTTNDVVSGVIMLLVLYGPAAASFTYCSTFMFSSPAYCNIMNIIFGFLIGFGGTVLVFLLWFLGNGWSESTGDDALQAGMEPKENLITAAIALTWTLRLFPSFCLGNGLFYAIQLGDDQDFVKGGGVNSVWHSEVLLFEVVFLLLQSITYLVLAIQLDNFNSSPNSKAMWQKLIEVFSGRLLVAPEEPVTYSRSEDDDVIFEQDRVESDRASSDLIVVKQLTKRYGNGKLAVNNLSLGIGPGECFGLLGINGAGKTTTMSILTTEFPPTNGDASLAGFSIRDSVYEARRRIGYCPQFDALFTNMTGREHVELYASIKGTPHQFVKEAAAAKLAAVGLSAFDCDRLSAHYSGGMKRRLSLACATIGLPRLCFFDEPTTGVDPVGRREIWMMISDMLTGDSIPDAEKPSVLLTTHSMEECEALSNRIGIMAHGRLRCLGSAQHLKTKFGRGYQIELRASHPQMGDEDVTRNLYHLGRRKPGVVEDLIERAPDEIFFNLHEAQCALQHLTGDNFLSILVTPENQLGYLVHKDASSEPGVTLVHLAHFATTHLRMRNIDRFIRGAYPSAILRENNELKARYEVGSSGLSIAHIFETVERNRHDLQAEDYSVSQTSLEQVFNHHAAEAAGAL